MKITLSYCEISNGYTVFSRKSDVYRHDKLFNLLILFIYYLLLKVVES